MTLKAVHNLNEDKISEYKEVFALFDKDKDGVLSLNGLNVVMQCLGQRPTCRDLHISSLHSDLYKKIVAGHGEMC